MHHDTANVLEIAVAAVLPAWILDEVDAVGPQYNGDPHGVACPNARLRHNPDSTTRFRHMPASVIDPKTSSAQHICRMATQLTTIVRVDRSLSAPDTFDCG
jgi:hypothetical protein